MKQNKPEFKWDKENGIATCTISNKYGEFKGEAHCHPEDKDMMSEIVGCEIAFGRATLQSFYHLKNNVIKPSLNALKQLYYSMKHSKKFNKKSYESKMLWGQIQNWQCDLDTVN